MKKSLTYTKLFMAAATFTFLTANSIGAWSYPKADANQDGVVTKEEALNKAEEKFNRKDTDGNGCISKAEAQANAEEKFNRLDKNGDGKITQDEKRWKHRKHNGSTIPPMPTGGPAKSGQ